MNKKHKRVVHVCKFYPPEKGGIEYVSEQYVNFYKSLKYKNEVVAFTSAKKASCQTDESINIFRFPFISLASQPLSIQYFKKVFRFLIRRPEVLHIHLPNYLAILGVLLTFWAHRKLIVHWHADSTSLKYHPIFILDILTVFLAHHVIFTTQEYFDHSPIRYFCRNKKVSIIPLTINQNATILNYNYRNNCRMVTKRRLNLLCIGRLVPYKGYYNLLHDLSNIKTSFHLTIVGDGTERTRLQKLVEVLGLQNEVSFKFGISDTEKNELLRASDVFVLYSHSRAEAFGIVILEAFACGLPVITKYNPGSGMRTLNNNGVTGYEVSCKQTLSNALAIIARKDANYDNLCKNAYERASEFSNEVAINKLKSLLDQ